MLIGVVTSYLCEEAFCASAAVKGKCQSEIHVKGGKMVACFKNETKT